MISNETVQGNSERGSTPSPRLLTPSARAKARFPRWTLPILVAAPIVSVVDGWVGFTPLDYLHEVLRIFAFVAGIAFVMWLEERVYGWMLGRHGSIRVLGAVAVPAAAVVVLFPVSVVLGSLGGWVGDQGTAGLLTFTMMAWLVSASLGTLLVVLVDTVVSMLVHDFRSRVQLAVLGLLTMASGLAVAVYGVGRGLADRLRTMQSSELPEGLSINLGDQALTEEEVGRLLAMTETAEVVAIAFFMAVALATLPAVLSATGKIADAVMERLHPLSTGFECVAQGDLLVRVEEKGSRDFVRINKGFNHMTTSLAQTLSNLDERNRELAELNEAAQRFVPFEFLKLLNRESLREVRRGDQVELEISVLFSDIRGFTPLAERLGPEATFRLINRYLGLMDPEIHSRGGFINDYLGDGIMALFNTGARDAVDAGVSMLRAVERLNTELRSEGADPIRVGIGIHTGRLMLGTLGGQQRLDCPVIGDPANLASRVEGMTKLYGARMLVTEETMRALVDPDRFDHRELDRVRAKGKTEPVTVYEVLDGPVDEAKVETRRGFALGLEAFRAGRFEDARVRFLECLRDAPEDAVAALYVERCETWSKSGVPEGWCGVTDLTQK